MTMQRIPEPELMDTPAQARAYAEADFSESNQAFVDRFVAMTDWSSACVLDLGCGPGDICIRLARALPDWQVIGLDAGPNMLGLAKEAVAADDLSGQIKLILNHLPCALPERGIDAIVSNSLLHHLPDPMALWTTISTQAPAGCLIQIMDLHRPNTESQARELVKTHAANAPEVLATDFYNSLLAAYTADEVAKQLESSGLTHLEISRPSDRHWLVQGVLNSH